MVEASGDLSAARRLEFMRRVWQAGAPVTKKQLATDAGYSLALTGRLASRLVVAGLLDDTLVGESSGGRRPRLVGLHPDLGYTVGLDIGGANVRGVACDLNGRVLGTLRLPGASRRLPAEPLPSIRQWVAQVLGADDLAPERLLGVGITISGVIDHAAGVCRFCPNIPAFVDLPVVAYLEETLGVPAVVDDSLRSGALAEQRFGVAGDLANFLWVGAGVGIGCAIVLNGQLHRGVGGMAGELGHFTVHEGGERCNCGNRGCLEVVASGPAIVRRARQSLQDGMHTSLNGFVQRGDDLTVEAIAQAASQGDKMAYFLMDRTGEYLGIAIAAALNLLGLQDVILAGGIARSGSILVGAVERTTRLRVLPALAPRISVRVSGLDDLACATGAAWQAACRLFEANHPGGGRTILDAGRR